MLECKNLSVFYGQHHALDQVSLNIAPGEIVVILGANGAGKSSLLKAIAGIVKPEAGSDIRMDGVDLSGMPAHQIVETGLALVPEGRGIFGELTVLENLTLGAFPERADASEAANLRRILELFPQLEERKKQIVRTMSGGEQQMVAIGRAMMSAPSILMLDEPSLGLSPILCSELFKTLEAVRGTGVGILLVEQNAKQSLAIADRGYLLEVGRITGEDTAENLARDPAVQKAYLGGAAGSQSGAHADEPRLPARAPAAVSPAPPAEDAVSAPAQPRDDLRITAGGHGSRRIDADSVIPQSIDDMVTRAASMQSAPAETPRPAPAPKPTAHDVTRPPANGDVQRMLSSIEQAAANALKRRPAATDGSPRAAPGNGAHEEVLPEIEVYRKPKIEVYRRVKTASGEEMKKIKGD